MKKVVFVSIDKPERWSHWHCGNTNTVYYSDFLDENDVNKFIEQVKVDYPDNNLTDNRIDHEYYIQYVVLDFDENDVYGFIALRDMIGAQKHYNKRK